MISQVLLKLKETHIKRLNDNYDTLFAKRSWDDSNLKRMQKNLVMWADFLKSVNVMANDFVDDINSPKFSSFSDKDRNEINDLYRQEVKEIVLTNNCKFILNE